MDCVSYSVQPQGSDRFANSLSDPLAPFHQQDLCRADFLPRAVPGRWGVALLPTHHMPSRQRAQAAQLQI